MYMCGKCSRVLRTSGVHRVIRTKTGFRRTAGLCQPCVSQHDELARQRTVKQAMFGIVGLLGVFAVVSYALLNYL